MTKIKSDKLLLSEDFYSIQGEGITSGYPAYFIRLTNCNLTCGASPKFVNEFKKGIRQNTPGDFIGDLHEQGSATWTCDTIPVWARGTEQDFQYLIDRWKDQGIYEDICSGLIHLIWTGGEPTIPGHQESIVNFMKYWSSIEFAKQVQVPLYNGESIRYRKTNGYDQINEIETNGTLYIDQPLFDCIDQINCSPKLSNSGMSPKMRIVEKAILRIMEHNNYQFKFVISSEDDVFEMFETFIKPFNIPLNKVVCMPGLDDQDDFHERTRFVMEMAKKYKFIGLTRLHVSAWNKTTGV
jgi:organic radical activating enzyme